MVIIITVIDKNPNRSDWGGRRGREQERVFLDQTDRPNTNRHGWGGAIILVVEIAWEVCILRTGAALTQKDARSMVCAGE